MPDAQERLNAFKALLPRGAQEAPLLFADVETQSWLDLRKVGAPRSTSRLYSTPCWAIAMDLNPVFLFTNSEEVRLTITNHRGGFCFHNAEYELWVIRHAYGIDIDPRLVIDSAAVARFNNLPGKLEDLGEYFGHPKDMEGHRIMLKLTKPRRPSKANPDPFWTPATKPEEFVKLYNYCLQDVKTARSCMLELEPPDPFEKRVMDMTVRMNRRGFPIDLPSVELAIAQVERNKAALVEECQSITGGISPSQVVKLAEHLNLPKVNKSTIRDTLRAPDITEHARQVLTLRKQYSRTSTDKLYAMRNRHLNGRIHDGFIYGGAERTLRYSGGGVQPQNLPRGAGEDTDELFRMLRAGEHLTNDQIADMLRGFICEPAH